jgi:outer membrane protein OmpA-like peptidoglycan-associated protein
MAKPLPKASRSEESRSDVDLRLKTPAGVWVIGGMTLFFAVTGLGTGIFIAFRSIAEKRAQIDTIVRAGVDRRVAAPAGTTAGAEHASPLIEEAGSTLAIVDDPVEQDAMRQEVLNRIDLMKALSQGNKDKLYAQVERARAFQKIAVIPFTQNRTSPSAGQVEALVRRLKETDMQKLVADPTVLLVMVGFADKQGDESKNLEVSRTRAESVVKALKERTDVANVMHSVGMGGQNLFDQSNLEKNRLVEVWAVQP